MPTDHVSFARLDPENADRFQPLRKQLGQEGFGLNLVTLDAGQAMRVHIHER